MDQNRTKFVVGLGNPGRKYQGTRHNTGFRVLEALAARWQVPPPRSAFCGQLADVRVGDQRVMLLAPQTYMNLSGQAVQELLTFYKAPVEDLLVVLDDLALPPGQLRFRASGSSGGQKGLADILARLGTDQVPRLRIGIGSPTPPMDATNYVLSVFGPDQEPVIRQAVQLAAQAVEDWVLRGMTYAMETYNRRGAEPADET